ncbi:B-box zinc finger protein 32-like [Dendrobium catenatum]|uniref:Zinc finger protein CONSTANS-LIKE 2 n=1 Tax=Dendrobium catenatum TaxID=906689 RepID=A0A2I0VQ57_9ASPA|nr:B-box zinc finger protein 32-like [Dendrobium catenatum]PKU65540.1 Zinc finger protein CONSTANS-LIKE 2 [Dendrobium catenatum]
MKKVVRRECELCKGEASVYCEADAAFLCSACDERVHGANFLAGRHVRAVACAGCRSFAAGTISGAGFAPIYSLCRACEPAFPPPTISCSSSCASTAKSASSAVVFSGRAVRLKRRRRGRITMVIRVLGEYGRSAAEVPIRVTRATEVRKKVRDGARMRGRKLASVILQADPILTRAIVRRRFAKEGWDQCP